jgi:tRNA G18 (ribose-2'-O)-methylase SpoU
MHRPALASVADVVAGARTIVILEDIVDHTNVGAAFRSAAWTLELPRRRRRDR